MTNRSLWRDEAGTSAIEYVALAALLAIGLVAALTSMGNSTSTSLTTVETTLGDGSASAPAQPEPAKPRTPIRARDKHS